MPRYEWAGGPNILGALDPGVQVSGGSNYWSTLSALQMQNQRYFPARTEVGWATVKGSFSR